MAIGTRTGEPLGDRKMSHFKSHPPSAAGECGVRRNSSQKLAIFKKTVNIYAFVILYFIGCIMSLKILSLSLYVLLFLTCKASALIIKINDKDSVVEHKIHMATGSITEFGFLQFSINGINYQHIESGTLSDFDMSEDEKIYFQVSSGNKAVLDVLKSQRLLTLLTSGWKSVIEYNQSKNLPFGYSENIPPCSYVMYYLGFNYSCFTKLAPEIKALLIPSEKLTSAVAQLNIGDIILIKEKGNSYDKNGVMFIGNSLFLWWDNQNQRFHIRSSKQLDNDFFPKNKQIIKVISVGTEEIPKPKAIVPALAAWMAFQKNNSEAEIKSTLRYSAEFTPLSSDNLPSYIK